MAAVLALDLGTTTGFMVKTAEGVEAHGIWKNKGGRFEGGGMRFLRFRGHLDEVHRITPIAAVFYEEVRRHRGTDAAHIYGGMLAVLTAFCEEHGIAYEGVPVGAIKKHVTGKGNADKRQMIAAVQKLGYSAVVDENEADAIAIMQLVGEGEVVRRVLGQSKPELRMVR
jgi:Holliday junction resolvasome RuvABC endonuclease subunit